MGLVYFAHHRAWGFPVAIKCPLLHAQSSQTKMQRFLREVDIWVNLEGHPNIVHAYYAKPIDDVPYVFIEFVGGGSLIDRIPYGTQAPLDMALKWAVEICDGMAHAHQHGLVHRDLKPQNVMLGDDGAARITDFGLVKLDEALTEDDAAPDDSDAKPSDTSFSKDASSALLTAARKHMGTPVYMPPEQWLDAHAVGPQADIYSFAVMLYQLICGRFPLGDARTTSGEFRRMHLEETPADSRPLRPDLSETMCIVLEKCLAKEPEDRFQSFSELRGLIDDAYTAVTGESIDAPELSDAERARELNNRAVTHVDMGRTDDGLRSLTKALASGGGGFVEARYNVALTHIRAGVRAPAEAIEWYDAGPDEMRNAWQYHYYRGLLHMETMALTQAQDDLRRALVRQPNDAELLNARALSLLFGGEHGPAVVCLSRAARLAPERLDIQRNLALAYRELGERRKASAIFDRIAQEALFSADDRARYAIVLALDGKSSEAKDQMERALREGGDSGLVQTLAAELKSGIDEFIPLPQPADLASLDAQGVFHRQAQSDARSLRLQVDKALASEPRPSADERKAKIAGFGKGICPRALINDPLAMWDCIRSSLSYFRGGRALGRLPFGMEVMAILAVVIALLAYPTFVAVQGRVSMTTFVIWAGLIAGPIALGAILARLGLGPLTAAVPFALAALGAGFADAKLYNEPLGFSRLLFVTAAFAFGALFVSVYRKAVSWMRAYWA